jgi:hypothetical protein
MLLRPFVALAIELSKGSLDIIDEFMVSAVVLVV